MNQYLKSTSTVKVESIDGGIFWDGAGTNQALIFYPGAKVEYTAYVPLLHQIAEQGIDIFLVKMPGSYAQFGDYGVQKGDGKAGITREEQQKQATDAIVKVLNQ